MSHISIQYHHTRIGEFILGEYKGQLCLLDYRHRKNRQTIDKRILRYSGATFIEQSTPLLELTKKQIDEYLNNQRTRFDIPFIMMGTAFQKQVWQALLTIPFGHTVSYLSLAKSIGNEKAVRAVATANGANAMSLLIPCHRIIGSNGALVGYAGGLTAKQQLIILEQQS